MANGDSDGSDYGNMTKAKENGNVDGNGKLSMVIVMAMIMW